MSDAPHGVLLEFAYDEPVAERVERSVRQEVEEIEGDRTTAAVSRDGGVVRVDVAAEDLVALRAGLNTWCSLVEVAERCSVVDDS